MKDILLYIQFHRYRITSKLWPNKCIFTPIEIKDGGIFCKCLVLNDYETIYIKDERVYIVSVTKKLNLISNLDVFIQALLTSNHKLRNLITELEKNELIKFASENYKSGIVYSELNRWLENGFTGTYSNRYSFLINDANKLVSISTQPRCNTYHDLYRKEHSTDGKYLNKYYKGDLNINGVYLQLSIDTKEFIQNYNILKHDIFASLEAFRYEMPNYIFNYQIVLNDDSTTTLTLFSTFEKLDIDNLLLCKSDSFHTQAFPIEEETLYTLYKSYDTIL